MTFSIPNGTIVGMLFTTLISVVLPIALVIVMKIKMKAKVSNFFIGCICFVFSVMVLEQILHNFVLKATGDFITNNIWLYAIYGGVCAALFEEIGRYVAMKFCMKNSLNKENALMYGIGHGGIEAILLVGFFSISNLITALMINNGQLTTTLATLDPALQEETIKSLEPLWTTPSYEFYMAGLERLTAIVLQIALSYLVYRSVRYGKKEFLGLAMLIHFVVDTLTLILAKYISIILLEIILLVAIAAITFVVVRLYREEKEEPTDTPQTI